MSATLFHNSIYLSTNFLSSNNKNWTKQENANQTEMKLFYFDCKHFHTNNLTIQWQSKQLKVNWLDCNLYSLKWEENYGCMWRMDDSIVVVCASCIRNALLIACAQFWMSCCAINHILYMLSYVIPALLKLIVFKISTSITSSDWAPVLYAVHISWWKRGHRTHNICISCSVLCANI